VNGTHSSESTARRPAASISAYPGGYMVCIGSSAFLRFGKATSDEEKLASRPNRSSAVRCNTGDLEHNT
jgi:hypothetical protein